MALLFSDAVAAGNTTAAQANAAALPAPTSPPLSSATIAPQTPIDISKTIPTSNTNQANGLVAGVANYNALLTPTDPASVAEQAQADTLTSRINDLIGLDANKGTDQLTQEQAAGLPGMKSQLADVNGQITQKTADYNAAFNSLENTPQQTAAVIGSKEQQLQRTQAADIGLLQAKGLALQGNITAAQDTVNRSIDLKYSSYENELTARQNQLTAVYSQLDKAQQKQADALKMAVADQQQQLADQKDLEKQIQTIAMQAAGNGASQGLMTAITNAKDVNTAIQLATPYLAKVQTQVVEVNGHSLLIDSNTGKTLQDLGTSNSIIQANIAHGGTGGGGPSSILDPTTDAGVKAIIAANPGEWGHAADAIDKKYGAGTATQYDSILKAVYQNGQNVNTAFGTASIPDIVTPYLNTASNGTKYVDASTLQGTASQKTAIIQAATKAGLKVITNKNTAADLVNIADANDKLDTINSIMSTLTIPSALQRTLGGYGLASAEVMTQIDANKAAAGALQSVGLDVLKAISGVQGFRGNATVVQQINDHLPKITDTTATAQTKINYIRKLITDRENAILGTTGSSGSSSSSNNDPLGLGL